MNNRYYLAFLERLLPRFKKSERTVSIIIQGPLNARSIKTIDSYLTYGEVIVSCWNTDDISALDEYKDKIKIVINRYEEVEGGGRFSPGSQAPWAYQNYTTLNGLLQANGYFSIKVRSDESYPDLQPLVDKLVKIHHEQKNPKTGGYDWHKIITSNIYFRRDRENKHHPSDHIVAGWTSRMIDVYEKALKLSSFGSAGKRFPEQLLCKAVVESRFTKGKGRQTLKDEESISQMKEHFDIIRISELPNHTWTSSYRKYDALVSEEDWCHDINDV